MEQRTTEKNIIKYYPSISWGAIFAGTIIIIITGLILSTLGTSLGLLNINPTEGNVPYKAIGIGAIIWGIISALLSTYIGAFVSGRFALSKIKTDAAMHGIMSWAIAMLIGIFFTAAITGAVISTAFGMISGGIQAVGGGVGQAISSASSLDINNIPMGLRTQIESLMGDIQQQAQDPAFQKEFMTIINTLMKGPNKITEQDKNQIANIVSRRANIPQTEARNRIEETIANYQNFQQELENFSSKAQQAVETTSQAAGAAAFLAFIMQLLAVGAAALGGISGAKSSAVER